VGVCRSAKKSDWEIMWEGANKKGKWRAGREGGSGGPRWQEGFPKPRKGSKKKKKTEQNWFETTGVWSWESTNQHRGPKKPTKR